jgi:hypothetical protein
MKKKIFQFVFIWIISLFISKGIKASNKKNIINRVNSVREGIVTKNRKDLPMKTTLFTKETMDKWINWGDWGNWNNWNNWANWADWNNWGNWGNWRNY